MTRPRSLAVRRGLVALTALVALAPVAARANAAATETIQVTLDKATILRMPANAATIVIGNPIIADVTTLKNVGLVVLTGKGFGETNLIFLDRTGTAVEEATVRVTGESNFVTVQRGLDRESYSCAAAVPADRLARRCRRLHQGRLDPDHLAQHARRARRALSRIPAPP